MDYIVGYGTLLNRGSLGQTIGQGSAENKEMIPVVVKDYMRLFNLRPEHYKPSYKLFPNANIEAAAMNVFPQASASFNGLAFPTTDEELVELDKRERYYKRHSQPLYHFETGDVIGTGHFYVCLPNEKWVESDIKQLLPRFQDIVLARTGAYGISHTFGKMYDDTTYLADGKTRMVTYYAEYLSETIEKNDT